MQRKIKCVAVGDTGVGKTRLLQSYSERDKVIQPESSSATNKQNIITTNLKVDDQDITLELWDTSGFSARIRKHLYTNADVILICFSVGNPNSFKRAKGRWSREVKRQKKDRRRIPYFLVGLQTDLRFDEHTLKRLLSKRKNPIKFEEGQQVATEINAIKYLECSSFTQLGVNTVFAEAVATALNPPPENKTNECIIS